MRSRRRSPTAVYAAVALTIVAVTAVAGVIILSTPGSSSKGKETATTTIVNSSSTTITTKSTSLVSALGDETVVSIPRDSSVPPPSFNVTELLSGEWRYRFNFSVVLGVNNTVVWSNDDAVAHTVSSFFVPTGAKTFNSDLIQPGATFSVLLTVPGVYKYTCLWHPWLAGEVVVKA